MIWSLFWSVLVLGFTFFSISAADVIEQIREKILKDHNKYRKRHHVLPLQVKDSITKVAQDWSDHLLKNSLFEHRPYNILGENLWAATGFTINDLLINAEANPVRSWYAEIEFYPKGSRHQWGHFTQLIWKDSKYLGCGISNNTKRLVVVCNYNPPGNWQARYKENVLPLDGASWGDGGIRVWIYRIGFVILLVAIFFAIFKYYKISL